MFSIKGSNPMTLIGSLYCAIAFITPTTTAAPTHCPLNSAIPSHFFKHIPPESNVTPIPARTIGLSSGAPPQYAISTKYGGSQDP
uniref:Putative secreted protein n=1 Tax=Panstrongylus lignarius TaxID=156445 RepID=A0A224Y403_9HEMI